MMQDFWAWLSTWTPLPEGSRLEWGRIQTNADWIGPIAALLAILTFVRMMYRRDAAELTGWLRWGLTVLRAAAFLGLLILYLQPQWRTERKIVHNSRVLVLVDTSQSMGLTNEGFTATTGSQSRLAQVAAALDDSDFLARLRKTHDLVVVPFNNALDRGRLVSLARLPPAPAEGQETPDPGDGPEKPSAHVSWRTLLVPGGTETRLGEALKQLIQDEQNSPLAGIVVVSDGGQNAGAPPAEAVELARRAGIPVFTVGIGSSDLPASVRVVDFGVPPRAYPGDPYTVTGLIQGQQLAGKTVNVELWSREAGPTAGATAKGEIKEAQRQVVLGGNGETVPVKFELTAPKPGRRILALRIEPPKEDRDPRNKSRETEIEIVARKNQVLLVAGGPTREYQFLHTQLRRDRSVEVDVLLQTGQEGISQEARKILGEFPAKPDEMYAYDCLVAFDPNWQALRPEQVNLLEKWVGDQAGGLVVIAGPVYAGMAINGWIPDLKMEKIRRLYPVTFPRYLSTADTMADTAKEPWPLRFTREGQEAEFLWLADTALASRAVWESFPGVYSCFPVRGAKPGATELATFSDPRAGQAGKPPVYLAEHLYGSGRVFYLGSGEMWRLRKIDPVYFERFYTKLLRHVSQGRLLRGSRHGMLLVGQESYLVGNAIEVRAQHLTDTQFRPIKAASVALQVIGPDGAAQTVTLAVNPDREGSYAGHFPAVQPGDYRLELTIPETANERLSQRIRVRVPDFELEKPQRNDHLLAEMAEKTGGVYYVGMSQAIAAPATPPQTKTLAERLPDRTRTELVTVAPNPEWEQTWLTWMMIALCSVLCLEWLIRRLMKLA